MSNYALDPEFIISTEEKLRDLYPATHEVAKLKALDTLDPHAREMIARSTFVLIGTQSADGRADVSPRGDPKGFVRVLDDRTIAIPDRPGNNRLDSMANMVTNPIVGLLFLIPGFDETLRLQGTARITTDPALLETMAVNDRLPRAAIVIDVKEVFLHCAKALRRGKLWDPTTYQNRADMPSLLNIVHEQLNGAPLPDDKAAENDEIIEDAYRTTMY